MASTSKPAAKLVISRVAARPDDMDGFIATKWAALCSVIDTVFHARAHTLSYQASFSDAYRLFTTVPEARKRDLHTKFSSKIASHMPALFEQLSLTPDPLFLTTFLSVWSRVRANFRSVHNIFMYWEDQLKNMGLPGPFRTSLNIFRDSIVLHPQLFEKLTFQMLSMIDAHRRGMAVADYTLLHEITEMMVELGPVEVYRELENVYLDNARFFYTHRVAESIASATTPEYLSAAQALIQEEKNLVEKCLEPETTLPKVVSVALKILIEDQVKYLIEKESTGAVALLKDSRYDDLRLMYRMFAQVKAHGLLPLRETFCSFFDCEIASVLQASQKRLEIVERLLDLRNRADMVLDRAFFVTEDRKMPDPEYLGSLNKVFEKHINASSPSGALDFAEALPEYADHVLKEGQGETELRRVVQTFRLLHAKDKFGEQCQRFLARRLLGGKSKVSEAAENAWLSLLRDECGPQYISRMVSMMDDIRTSRDLMGRYVASGAAAAHAGPSPSPALNSPAVMADHFMTTPSTPNSASLYGTSSHAVEFNAFVLKTGCWPMLRALPFDFPTDMQRCIHSFTTFYEADHKNRKLVWAASVGTAKVEYRFKGRVLSLSVSTMQAAILLLFNDRDRWSYVELTDRLKGSPNELKGNLACLSTNKKEKRLWDILVGKDVLSLNDAFEAPKNGQIVVNTLVAQEAKEAKKETDEKVQEQRNFELDCAIVRVMKARRRLPHNELLQEVATSVRMRFEPHVEDIKRRIGSLIDREFLDRDNADRNVYVYKA